MNLPIGQGETTVVEFTRQECAITAQVLENWPFGIAGSPIDAAFREAKQRSDSHPAPVEQIAETAVRFEVVRVALC